MFIIVNFNHIIIYFMTNEKYLKYNKNIIQILFHYSSYTKTLKSIIIIKNQELY